LDSLKSGKYKPLIIFYVGPFKSYQIKSNIYFSNSSTMYNDVCSIIMSYITRLFMDIRRGGGVADWRGQPG
jgi:hypothetical protein